MSPEELNARDMAIEQQLNFISKQSAPKEMANKPLKIKSEVTKDMVDDFKAEQEGSIFHPPSILPVLETPIYDAELNKPAMLVAKKNIIMDIEAYKAKIDLLIKDRKELDEAFDKDMAIIRLSAARKSVPAAEIAARQQDLLDAYNIDKARIEATLEAINREIARLTGILDRIDRDIRDADKIIQKNEGEKARVERLNRQAVKNFENDAKALNQGININQQVGESDEDYLQRIENMKGARYGQDMITQATTFNVKRFKTKMKEIMTIPEEKLEKIIKYLENDNMLYDVNKKFPLVKSAIERTYGVKPRFLNAGDEDDLYNFIYNTITKQFQEREDTNTNAIVVAEKNSDLIAKSRTGYIPKRELLNIYYSLTGRKTFGGSSQNLADEIIRLREMGGDVKEPSSRGRPTKAEATRRQEVEDMSKEEGLSRAVEQRSKARRPLEKILAVAESVRSPLSSPQLVDTPPSEKIKVKRPFAKGKGVEREFYPKLVPFGAITISPAQLFYYKVLRVREPTKHSIRGLPDVRVSDDMVYILMKIINGGTPSMTELRALSDEEKTIYDAVITKAKLHKEMPNNSSQSINKLKNRLELCEGEWHAGNDNTKIKKELNSIIRQLTELKAITEQEGRRYLKQF